MVRWSSIKFERTTMRPLHPYKGRPDYQFWKKEPGIGDPQAFDPVTATSFVVSPDDAVVTAGSCFAQHVARFLASRGFNFLVTERANSAIDDTIAREHNYGLFSARYGNIYTARQLRQLLARAYGQFEPRSHSWQLHGTHHVIDPFRPQIQPGGYVSERELDLDRQQHLTAVRKAIEAMDVFVFTLGLTEAWCDSRDGAVFPLAPGVAGGSYEPEIHAFHNFTVDETVKDMQESIDFIRSVNPQVRIILTVSPVALNASAVDRHVFVSTTYSKSVLRVAAQRICDTNALCDYFPSYEIITSPFVRGAYFASDCRDVLPAGVEHVMSLFLRHYAGLGLGTSGMAKAPIQESRKVEELLEALCDEEAIGND
jgi:hypothetical protein